MRGAEEGAAGAPARSGGRPGAGAWGAGSGAAREPAAAPRARSTPFPSPLRPPEMLQTFAARSRVAGGEGGGGGGRRVDSRLAHPLALIFFCKERKKAALLKLNTLPQNTEDRRVGARERNF